MKTTDAKLENYMKATDAKLENYMKTTDVNEEKSQDSSLICMEFLSSACFFLSSFFYPLNILISL